MAEAELLRQKQTNQNETEKLKIKERLVMVKARIQVCSNIDFESGNENEQPQLKSLEDPSIHPWICPQKTF